MAEGVGVALPVLLVKSTAKDALSGSQSTSCEPELLLVSESAYAEIQNLSGIFAHFREIRNPIQFTLDEILLQVSGLHELKSVRVAPEEEFPDAVALIVELDVG